MGRKSAKRQKHLDRIKKPEDAQPIPGDLNDIVIPIMGPTGVGKSSFVNSLLDSSQIRAEVGHGLQSCTSQLNPIVIPFASAQNAFKNPYGTNSGRLIFVDTPGFDDTYADDGEILRRISVWLAQSYNNDMKLGGVIYLHDITQTRMLGTTVKNLDMFRKLVGQDALKRVVLGTTKWDMLSEKTVGIQRQRQLESTFWNEMIGAGSSVAAIDAVGKSRDVVQLILEQIKKSKVDTELAIQNELLELEKYIPETKAGKTLRYTIEEAMELQRQRENNPELLSRLQKVSKQLNVPLSDHIKRFFGR